MIMAAVFVMSACGGSSPDLTGRWRSTTTNAGFELFSDGTATGHFGGPVRDWSVDGDRIRIRDRTGTFTLSGDTLTIEFIHGTQVFIRMN